SILPLPSSSSIPTLSAVEAMAIVPPKTVTSTTSVPGLKSKSAGASSSNIISIPVHTVPLPMAISVVDRIIEPNNVNEPVCFFDENERQHDDDDEKQKVVFDAQNNVSALQLDNSALVSKSPKSEHKYEDTKSIHIATPYPLHSNNTSKSSP